MHFPLRGEASLRIDELKEIKETARGLSKGKVKVDLWLKDIAPIGEDNERLAKSADD